MVRNFSFLFIRLGRISAIRRVRRCGSLWLIILLICGCSPSKRIIVSTTLNTIPVITGSVVNSSAFDKGGTLFLGSFKPGTGAAANDETDQLSAMMIKGIKEDMEARWAANFNAKEPTSLVTAAAAKLQPPVFPFHSKTKPLSLSFSYVWISPKDVEKLPLEEQQLLNEYRLAENSTYHSVERIRYALELIGRLKSSPLDFDHEAYRLQQNHTQYLGLLKKLLFINKQY